MASDPNAAEGRPAGSRTKRGLKVVGRGVVWPARRFVDPRVEGMLAHVDGRNEELYARIATLIEGVDAGLDARVDTLTRRLVSVQEAQLVQGQALHDIGRELERIFERVDLPRTVDELRGEVADFLNFAFDHRGFAAQEGIWINPPVSVHHRTGRVEIDEISERIVEIPYVFRALGSLSPGAAILDVGASESTVSLSLASLGYKVTALDPRPYPFSHPRLSAVQARVEEWQTDEHFDAVICLSTIEHVGLSAYEQEENTGADRQAMRRIHELTSPGGRLVLTAPFGEFHVDSFQRTYDREHLDELLEGWEIDDFALLRRTAPTRWELEDEDAREGELVVLVTAIRSG